ncbi:hypothetical protein EVJ58_g1129 [Rhodofomes roseus]|uniref:Uncharacterized protein n=1 Tax=Rhodofomes roseus TaxID=34475 RepID=A0A4Y9Z116_9APHY|nr:hypothetical protein EVJ58_g1129 [Rhodofomes roseus]
MLRGPAYGSSEQRHPGVYEARTSSSSLAGALEERPLWTSVGLQRNTGTIAPWQQSVGPYPAAPVRMGLRNVHRRTTTSEKQIPSARRYPHTGSIPGPDHSQQREEAWLSPASGHPPMFAPDPPPYTARALQPQTALRTDLEYPVPAPNLGRQQQLPYADPTYPPYEMRSYPAASSATFDAGGIPEYAMQGSTQLTPPSLPVLVHASGAIADPYGAASSMSFANIPSYPVTQGPISDASRDETARSPSYEAFSSTLDAYSFEAFQPELEGSD